MLPDNLSSSTKVVHTMSSVFSSLAKNHTCLGRQVYPGLKPNSVLESQEKDVHGFPLYCSLQIPLREWLFEPYPLSPESIVHIFSRGSQTSWSLPKRTRLNTQPTACGMWLFLDESMLIATIWNKEVPCPLAVGDCIFTWSLISCGTLMTLLNLSESQCYHLQWGSS